MTPAGEAAEEIENAREAHAHRHSTQKPTTEPATEPTTEPEPAINEICGWRRCEIFECCRGTLWFGYCDKLPQPEKIHSSCLYEENGFYKKNCKIVASETQLKNEANECFRLMN
ncbi:hypothetical protein TNCV_4583971 [Trichonephila clavipes]|nr:hypothetical protein TNCV_4583971 [Trichonephila clavipes]